MFGAGSRPYSAYRTCQMQRSVLFMSCANAEVTMNHALKRKFEKAQQGKGKCFNLNTCSRVLKTFGLRTQPAYTWTSIFSLSWLWLIDYILITTIGDVQTCFLHAIFEPYFSSLFNVVDAVLLFHNTKVTASLPSYIICLAPIFSPLQLSEVWLPNIWVPVLSLLDSLLTFNVREFSSAAFKLYSISFSFISSLEYFASELPIYFPLAMQP